VFDEPKSKSLDKNTFEELAVVYVLYFDEAHGHTPLLIYPDDRYKDDKKFMRPIKYHPIWFLGEGSDALSHIDLEFKGYTFFGKKFLTTSKRKKRRAGLEEETPETIVIILSLPNKLELFGDDLIQELTKKIEEEYRDTLFEIIESEIALDNVIKSPKTEKIIERGTQIKDQLEETIDTICNKFFRNAVRESDRSSIRMQKAIAYLALKGIDMSHIQSSDYKDSFSSVQLFDPNTKNNGDLLQKNKFSIKQIDLSQNSNELEILVKNNTDDEISDISVEITHVKEFFEKEIMRENIQTWFPKEELVFISPVFPQINEYLFFIIDKKTNERILSKKIDTNSIIEKKV
jgi:hypothetical protein